MGKRLIHKDQKGFTMLELLIVLAITALITTSITMAISQTFTGSTRSSNHMVVVRQVQEAGYWVSYYGYGAQNTTITGVGGFPLIMRWIDFVTGQKQKIVFSVNSSGLKGNYYVSDVFNAAKTGTIPVFAFINANANKTNCQISGGSDFRLPDIGDAFKITGGAIPDNGIINCTSGSISFTKTGGATCVNVTGGWTWTTNTTGDTITITASSSNTAGSWTSEIWAATAAMTVDNDTDATLSSARGLILTVTATAGAAQQQENETRTYIVVPKTMS
jgi:prepilin-type N-terminal cleavage/methylation domain-containing protein